MMKRIAWTKSPLNNEIELYSSCNSLKDLRSPMIFIGGVHGDEPEGVYLAQSLLNWMANQNPTSIQPTLIIPCLNIDGYKINQRTNSRGVDLNRNFPTDNWSSEYKLERYKPGEFPNSEIETQKLVELLDLVKPRLIFHFHSWKPCVVVTGPLGLPEVTALSEASGFEIVQDIGYPTPGSLGDYGWNQLQIPVICTEDYEHRDSQKPWLHFGEGLKKIVIKV